MFEAATLQLLQNTALSKWPQCFKLSVSERNATVQYVAYDMILAASPIKSEDSEGKTKTNVPENKNTVCCGWFFFFFLMLLDVFWRKTYKINVHYLGGSDVNKIQCSTLLLLLSFWNLELGLYGNHKENLMLTQLTLITLTLNAKYHIR